MNKHLGNFQHHCYVDDNDCWRKQFVKIIQCEDEEPACWRRRLPQLPCNLDDIECWKKNIPDLPCQITDFQCLQNKLPPLPCKLLDTICWQRYIRNRQQDGTGKTMQGNVPRAPKKPLNWIYAVDAQGNASQT